MCVGPRLSLQHLFLMTATIMQKFRIDPGETELSQPSCHPKDMELSMVMRPKPYTIRVKERQPEVQHKMSIDMGSGSYILI